MCGDMIFMFGESLAPSNTQLYTKFKNKLNLKSFGVVLSIGIQKSHGRFDDEVVGLIVSHHHSCIIVTCSNTFKLFDLKTKVFIRNVSLPLKSKVHSVCIMEGSRFDQEDGLYLFCDDYYLYKYDLTQLLYDVNCKPVWKISSHINHRREIFNKVCIAIVLKKDACPQDGNYLLMCEGSCFTFYSTIHGAIVKQLTNPDLFIQIRCLQMKTANEEEELIACVNHTLAWISLKTMEVNRKVNISKQGTQRSNPPSESDGWLFPSSIVEDETTGRVLVMDVEGFICVYDKWSGKRLKQLDITTDQYALKLQRRKSPQIYCLHETTGELLIATSFELRGFL